MNAQFPDDYRSKGTAPTRIVGLGASAGGLEALLQFFAKVPLPSGLAYIVVQHLDPTQKAMLTELLQRSTAMRVIEATYPCVWKPAWSTSFHPTPNSL